MGIRYSSIDKNGRSQRHPANRKSIHQMFFICIAQIKIIFIPLSIGMVISFYGTCCQADKEHLVQKANSLSAHSDSSIDGNLDSLLKIQTELEIEELFWKNRVLIAGDKSIDLVIDLEDSLLCLEIRGVPLREIRINQHTLSTSMLYLKWYSAYKTWLKDPFQLQNDSISTIVKEPVYVKDLTSHPLEYYDDWTYFNRLENEGPVHYLLKYNRGLRVQIDQDSSAEDLDLIGIDEFHGHWIKLKIPAADAKAIYRALIIPSEMVLRY
jgi:hypothetical protein